MLQIQTLLNSNKINMKSILCLYIFFLIFSCAVTAQERDTVFHKRSSDKYEATVLKKGYHHLYTVKYRGYADSVWRWDFGAYMDVRILDIVVEDDKYMSINSTADDLGYAIYEYKGGKWQPLMGGILRFFNNSSDKIEALIIGKDKIQVKEKEKITIYKLDFVRKTIEVYDDK